MQGAHRQSVLGRHVLCLLGVALAIVVRIAPVHAEDRVAVLTKMLASSKALGDRSARVRAVAATALGRLGCELALTPLRGLAQDDTDDDVRKAASTAVMKIAKANRGTDDRAKPEPDAQARRATPNTGHGAGHPAADAEGHAAGPHPDLYLLINSSADDSPGTGDKPTRKAHADIVRRTLIERFKADKSITSAADEAQRWGLVVRHIDLSVTKLDVAKAGGLVEIDAQLRLAISDDSGKMLSFLSGGAKVQVPSAKFDARYVPALRKEALENAMRGMFAKLLAHLRDQAQI
jgi:hypothetical protein